MSAPRTAAAKSPFAHLNGVRAEDPDDNKDPKNDGDATGADGDPDPEDDETDPKDGKKGKKARKADDTGGDPDEDGDDDTDAEDEKDDDKAKARARERGRCAAIFASEGAGRNPAAAAEIAFNTTLGRSAAVRLLSAMPAAAPAVAQEQPRRAPALRDRMATEGRQAVPAPGAQTENRPGSRLAAAISGRRGGTN
ncbi:hypothetical protein [Acetobacter estunensis]|uniref:hypothetical protein n=1 Tax=Acetobacter estunensis TaxID=104097 RepID=UPI001C2DE2CC|nr:hypothetical protein [Acetobacter estunensis]MBV1835648.1 hypothetical protein [Acetobacter estunensis]MBV1836091.1 hypothetical protein [Acetobacter estunensis]